MRSKFVMSCIGCLALTCAVVAVGLWQLQARRAMLDWDPERARRANDPIPVRTVTVDKRDLQETIGGTAVTMPAQSATISIPLSASDVTDREVEEVAFWPGSAIKQGDILIKFQPDLFRQIVLQREAMVTKCQQEFETMAQLYQQKAASGLQVKSAEVALETARLDLALAKQDLELCEIHSPITGVIDNLNVVPQMRVGGDAVLATIHQLNPIHVEMDYPMERIDSLHLGQDAEVVLDAFPQETFQGKVTRIAPVVSTKTRVLPVTIEIQNPVNRIRAGISGFARVTRVTPGATTVPSVAVIMKQQKAMVVCVEKSRAKIREVHTGPVTEAGEIQILDGLSSGDEVIIFGQDAVQENDLVNVDWLQWTRRDPLSSVGP